MPKPKHGTKDYLTDMLLQFDPTEGMDLAKSETYLKSLTGYSPQLRENATRTEYGSWTLMKHIFLFEYLRPFFQIGGLRFRRLVYIDMFAGPGINIIPRNGRSFVTPGSPLISYRYTYANKVGDRRERFDAYYFFEKHSDRAKVLQERLDKLGNDFHLDETANVRPIDSPSNVWKVMEDEVNHLKDAKKIATRHDTGLLFLINIDPEGLGLKFDTLLSLVKRYVATPEGDESRHYFTADVIYTAPTHWVKQSGNPENLRIYCGIDPRRAYSDDQVAEMMAHKIKEEVKGNCFVHTIPVRNATNALMYHIFFVTKSPGASNGADHLKKSLRVRARDLQTSLDTLMVVATTMDNYGLR
jgi:three-Cys-motif partner protein